MAKQIAKLLKADINDSSNLAMIAKMLEKKGRANDTILAHITEREANLLKQLGGAGTVNPQTGLLEFYDGYDAGVYDAGLSYDAPVVSQTTGEPMTQQEVYAANPDLYPGGADYAGQPTVYIPSTAGGGQTQFSPVDTTTVSSQPVTPVVVGQDVARANPYDVEDMRAGQAAQTQELTKAPPPPEKSWYDKLTTADMIRLGLVGGLAAYGSRQAKKAAEQGQQAAEEQRALARPYQERGAELQRAAGAGELTPQAQQSLQALQARMAQGAESRGGVGAAQMATQLEAYRQQLLQQQYNLGLQVSQIGDNIALGAIRTGLQADQQMNQASTNFYTTLAMVGAGVPISATR